MNLAHTIQQRHLGRLAVYLDKLDNHAVNPNNLTHAVSHPDFKEEVL